MKLFVALAVFEGCPKAWLDDPAAVGAALEAALVAGSFTRQRCLVVPFSPQGVTACAVISESHVALHSWPEEGRLFVDVASCTTRQSVLGAVDAIARAMPEGRLAVLDERELDAGGARCPAAVMGCVPDPARA